MKVGYGCIKPMCAQLLEFMEQHGFESLSDFKGHSLPFFTTHAELVRMQAEAKAAEKSKRQEKMITGDEQWSGEDFVDQTDRLSRG